MSSIPGRSWSPESDSEASFPGRDAAFPEERLPSPSRLLSATAQVVPFQERPELQALQDWCRYDGRAEPVLAWLTGGPGSGKSRLLLRLLTELAADGWYARALSPEVSPADIVAALRRGERVFVGIDDAPARLAEVAELAKTVGREDANQLRVLLLGEHPDSTALRSGDRIVGLAAELLSSEVTFSIPSMGDEHFTARLVEAAYGAFRRMLGRPATPASGSSRLAAYSDCTSIGEVCAVALAASLGAAAEGGATGEEPAQGGGGAAGAYRVLHVAERARWAARVRRAGLGFHDDEHLLSQTLSVLTLAPARDRAAAVRLMSELPRFRGGRPDAVRTVEALRETFPPEGGHPYYVATLTPRALADDALREVLRAYGDPDRGADVFARAVLAVDPADLAGSLSVLCRLAGLTDAPVSPTAPGDASVRAAEAAMTVLLRDHAEHCLAIFCEVSARIHDVGPLLSAWEEAFDRVATKDALDAYVRLPLNHVGLTDLAAKVLQRLLRTPPDAVASGSVSDTVPGAGPDGRRGGPSLLYRHASLRLFDSGQYGQAAHFAQRAVDELRAQDPYPAAELVDALTALSQALSALGHADGAGCMAEEAVKLARRRAPGHLEDALQHLATARHTGNDAAGACDAALEALEIVRERAAAAPGDLEARSSLASALGLAGAMSCEVGALERSVEYSGQALDLLQEMVSQSGALHLRRYLATLGAHGNVLGRLGRDAEAFSVTEEALVHLQELDRHFPGIYRGSLAKTQLNFGNRLRALGDRENALTAYRNALTNLNDLFQKDPQAHGPHLSIALLNYASLQGETGAWDEAARSVELSVTLGGSCVREGMPWVIPDLLNSIDFLKECLIRLHRFAELPSIQRQVEIFGKIWREYQREMQVGGSRAASDGLLTSD